MALFWNGLNDWAHRIFQGEIVRRVNLFTRAGQVHVLEFLADPLHAAGLLGNDKRDRAKARISKRAGLGIHPVGLTALFGMLFLLAFLLLT